MAITATTVATAATVAAAAATAGSAAYSASQSGGGKHGGGHAPGLPEMPGWEHVFNRGTADLLDEERRTMEDALGQANFLQPEMYKLLGFDPVYDTTQDANVKGLSDKFESLQKQVNDGRQRILEIGAALKGGGRGAADRRALNKERAQLKRMQPNLQRQMALAQRELGDAQAVPRRIVGFNKLDHPADPTQSKGDLFRMAFDLQNDTLVRALKGEEPVDATLKTEFTNREKMLRERLRRTLGSDYETSSAGMEALANFDREKSEAFEQFNQQLIQSFSSITESRATALSNLTGARLQQMMFPANEQIKRGLSLGQAASDRNQYEQLQQQGRGQKLEASKARADYEQAQAAKDAARAQAIAGLGSSLGSGLSSAAPTLGRYLGPSSSPAPASSPDLSLSYGGRTAPSYSLDYGSDINRYLGA